MFRLFLVLALAGGVAGVLDARSVAPAAGPATVRADGGPVLSIHVVTERVDARGRRRLAGQSLVRTDKRIALTPDGSRKEWVFERNPLDPARVSGYLIDHAARRIVVYQESDLRNREGLAAWGDVWHMRVDPRNLKQMTRTAERPQVNGVPFVRYRREGSGTGTVLVDWSDEHGLPGRVEVRDAEGVTVSQVDRLVPLTEAAVPGEPTSRHADYGSWMSPIWANTTTDRTTSRTTSGRLRGPHRESSTPVRSGLARRDSSQRTSPHWIRRRIPGATIRRARPHAASCA